ncbi:hypothetical protein, partial [Streptomyces mutabilis]|uniref:hypothetical protein n=1 Tax=Streptomyces mutabilis TaxID=67332 RepID=UPI0036918021
VRERDSGAVVDHSTAVTFPHHSVQFVAPWVRPAGSVPAVFSVVFGGEGGVEHRTAAAWRTAVSSSVAARPAIRPANDVRPNRSLSE